MNVCTTTIYADWIEDERIIVMEPWNPSNGLSNDPLPAIVQMISLYQSHLFAMKAKISVVRPWSR